MAKLWNVQAGKEGEKLADHLYESPKDALKVAKRYIEKSHASAKHYSDDEPGDVRHIKTKGARVYTHEDPDGGNEKYAAVTPAIIRKKNFAFRD